MSILVVDFGSQYTQLLASRISSLNVRCQICKAANFKTDDLDTGIRGVILSGGPGDPGRISKDIVSEMRKLLSLDRVAILGICLGAQIIAYLSGCSIIRHQSGAEFGETLVQYSGCGTRLFKALRDAEREEITVCMSHNYTICSNDWNVCVTMTSVKSGIVAAFELQNRRIYGLQFHPEVASTPHGTEMLAAFCDIAGCAADWSPQCKIQRAETYIRNEITASNGGAILLALSGGVDSTTVAHLLSRVCADKLFCVFVDTGFFRDEDLNIINSLKDDNQLRISIVDMRACCISELSGVADPEKKRKILGAKFFDAFISESRRLERDHGIRFEFLAQGTIYPDIVESKNIKSHHNVGGLPKELRGLKLLEPLRELFKNDVRDVASQIGVSDRILRRHPFPGPGLAIRIMGDQISEMTVRIARQADAIFIAALRSSGLYDLIWQAGAIVTKTYSTGVRGDERFYGAVVALRAIVSVDGMTAEVFDISVPLLREIAREIVNRIPEVSRVVYDVTDKPPATIEWE